MSITEQIKPALHIEAKNEILSIQQAAIIMASNNLYSRLNIHKKPVDQFTLDYLSAYFSVSIKMASETHNTEPYIKIVSDHCDIIITLKTETNE